MALRKGRPEFLSPSPMICLLILSALGAVLAGCAMKPPVQGVRPESPEVRYSGLSTKLAYTEVDSLTPELRWQTFPRQDDLDIDTRGVLSRIEEVSYDLMIWRVENHHPFELVYAVDGLAGNCHQVERALLPSTKYMWTVRARFRYEGRTRVTEWAVSGARQQTREPSARRSLRIPEKNYFRFMTPAE